MASMQQAELGLNLSTKRTRKRASELPAVFRLPRVDG
jgi:hypothetical protein